MSVWLEAKRVTTDALGAMLLLNPGSKVKQGEIVAPEPLEQAVTTLVRAADFLDGLPDCQDFAEQLRVMAVRYNDHRPVLDEWKRDVKALRLMEAEMMSRLTR